jgi:hypothetical protein
VSGQAHKVLKDYYNPLICKGKTKKKCLQNVFVEGFPFIAVKKSTLWRYVNTLLDGLSLPLSFAN